MSRVRGTGVACRGRFYPCIYIYFEYINLLFSDSGALYFFFRNFWKVLRSNFGPFFLLKIVTVGCLQKGLLFFDLK